MDLKGWEVWLISLVAATSALVAHDVLSPDTRVTTQVWP